MKLKYICLLNIITIIIFNILVLPSCSHVHFDSDMPRQKEELNEFNSDLVGKYYLVDSNIVSKDNVYFNSKYYSKLNHKYDSITLISVELSIYANSLVYYVNAKSYYNLNKIDSARIIYKHRYESRSIQSNYIIFENSQIDTIIKLKDKDNLKFYENKYYLNHFITNNDWEIFQLELNRNDLVLCLMNEKDEKILFNNLIKKHEVLGNILHLSNIQFANFVKKGGFRTRFKFKKIVP